MRVEELESEIQKLDRVELASLTHRFQNYVSDEWDRQIESDIRSGRLDTLAAEALAEHEEGKTRESWIGNHSEYERLLRS